MNKVSPALHANQHDSDGSMLIMVFHAASRLRQGIERLQDKVSEREKRVSESLARVESITAHAHALQDSLAAAASTAPLSNDGKPIACFQRLLGLSGMLNILTCAHD
jgi:hypothetical protein